jgi:hypothetical protein
MTNNTARIESLSVLLAARALNGKEITHYFVDDGYWHGQVFLRTADGTAFEFFAEEHSLAKFFDVNTLAFAGTCGDRESWNAIQSPIRATYVRALWRDEWLVPGATGPTVGTTPHTQFSGPVGSAPTDAVHSATLLAGILFSDGDKSIVVTASASVPLSMDVVLNPVDIAELVSEHTLLEVEV